MPLSTYAANHSLNHWFRGVDPPNPANVYMSMHPDDPGNTGANEVDTADWPAYVRKRPAGGGALSGGFAAASNKGTANALDILFNRHDGVGTVEVAYVGFWDAETGGNFIAKGIVVDSNGDPTSKVFSPDDEAIFYAGEILIVVDP
jgi:hypothetical protein